jgi:hypothetical protein
MLLWLLLWAPLRCGSCSSGLDTTSSLSWLMLSFSSSVFSSFGPNLLLSSIGVIISLGVQFQMVCRVSNVP